MRYTLIFAAMLLMLSRIGGCAPAQGDEQFYDRHPEYNNRPDYFEKDPGYDNQIPTERSSSFNQNPGGDRNA